MTYHLIDSKGIKYVDPFTQKDAIFENQHIANITRFMLFDQQERIFEVKED